VNWPLLGLSVAAGLFGYLCGSIPFGVLFTQLAGIQDVRSIGSGNIGATNVLRTGNKTVAAATLAGDMLKGTVAALIPLAISANRNFAMVAAFAAFLGHLYPVWLRFKGGKGVATYIGILIALAWPAALVFALVWLLVAVVTRYSSLSALVASAATPAILLATSAGFEPVLFGFLTLILWAKHRDNIARLVQGTEGKIG
jgi:glycerol-3-phosphate acyltransferase PlsY